MGCLRLAHRHALAYIRMHDYRVKVTHTSAYDHQRSTAPDGHMLTFISHERLLIFLPLLFCLKLIVKVRAAEQALCVFWAAYVLVEVCDLKTAV